MSPAVFAETNTAVITGGASGIGLALANKCAKAGMNILLLDKNQENLSLAEKYLAGKGPTPKQLIKSIAMDVSKLEDWEMVKETLESDFAGTIHLIALNAGTSMRGTWASSGSAEYFQKILSVNLFGVINGINSLLPYIPKQDSLCSIIITGSKQGITNPPGNPAYNASKAAVKTLAEHLSFDLAKSHPHVSTHLLVPGWTYTGMTGGGSPFESSGDKVEKVEKEIPKGAWSPEQVVEYLEKKMEEGKFYVLCPDGDVTEEMDKKRMAWGASDAVEGRQPLSRWRGEYKEEFEKFMKKDL